jgi:hypothetical protein
MKHVYRSIQFEIVSLDDFESEDFIKPIIDLFFIQDGQLSPKRFGSCQPYKTLGFGDKYVKIRDVLFDAPIETFNEKTYKTGNVILSNDKCSYSLSFRKSISESFSYVGGIFDYDLVKDGEIFNYFLFLSRKVFLLANGIYGEILNMGFPGWEGPSDLQKRLPDIPWMSYYGKPYIDFFGKEKILSAPFHEINVLSEDAIQLQASPSIWEPVPEDTKDKIRNHLGSDCFMRRFRRTFKVNSAPVFDFSKVLLRPEEL